MEYKNLIPTIAILMALFGTTAMGAYTADYIVSDMDDIVIDLTGTAMVEVKTEVPTLVDLGVLFLIISILLLIVAGIVTLFAFVPKKMGATKATKRL